MPVAMPAGHTPLRTWLLDDAGVGNERVDELMAVLAQQWVTDVETLVRCLHALERVVPAAAFVAISAAVERGRREGNDDAAPKTEESVGLADSAPDVSDSNPHGTRSEAAGNLVAVAPSAAPTSAADAIRQEARLREEVAAKRRREFLMEVRATRRTLRRARLWALHPSSHWLTAWRVLGLAPALVWTACVTPYAVGFLDFRLDGVWYAERAVDAILLLDCLLAFFVGFRQSPARGTQAVLSLRRIATRYACTWLVVDALSMIPHELVLRLALASILPRETSGSALALAVFDVPADGARDVAAGASMPVNSAGSSSLRVAQLARLVALARMVKLLRLWRVRRVLEQWEDGAAPVNYTRASAAALVTCTLLLMHWLACAWGYVGRTEALLGAASGGVDPRNGTALAAAGWVARSGGRADGAAYELYAVSLHMVLTMTIGGPSEDGGQLGTASDIESGARLAIGALGGVGWLLVAAWACSLAPGLWPQLADDVRASADVAACASERHLPPGLTRRMHSYLLASRSLARSAKHERLLERMSARLRGDTAHALALPLAACVPYLSSDACVERDFVANVGLSLERALLAPREQLAPSALTLIERGLAARHGRLLAPGACLGEDMVVARALWRDQTSATALSYVQVATLSRARLGELLASGEYPGAQLAVRYAAVGMALRRAILLIAARVRQLGVRTASARPAVAAHLTLATPALAAAGGEAGLSVASGGLVSAVPMMELLAEAEAAEAADPSRASALRAAAIFGHTARTPPSYVPFGQSTVDSGPDMLTPTGGALHACSARLEASIDSLGARLQQAFAHEAPTRTPAPRNGRLPRTRRNVCRTPAQPSAAAPTICVTPGQSLPPDHCIAQLATAGSQLLAA